MIKKYCRIYFITAAVFLALSFFSDNAFVVFYPCLLCEMIPVNLLGYDERSGWLRYCGTLPYTKAQIVSAKYLSGLFSTLAVILVSAAAQAVKAIFSTGDASSLLMLPLLWLSAACLSLSLPPIFRFGTEKGRAVYLAMVGLFFGIIAAVSSLFSLAGTSLDPAALSLVCLIAGCGVYALSWYLSIMLFKRREI